MERATSVSKRFIASLCCICVRDDASRYDIEPGDGILHLMHRKETASDTLVEKRRRVERGESHSEELDGTYILVS